MTREEYIDSNITKIFHQWLGIVFLTAAILIILLSFLDYFVTKTNFETFLTYRFITSILFIMLYFANRQKKHRVYQTILLLLGTIIVSVMIELMVLKFGGYKSPYGIAIVLTIIYAIGFMPVSLYTGFIAAGIIYSIYLVPILLFDRISDIPYFISVNVFLLSIISFTLIWKYFNQNNLYNELGLQYDLDIERGKLKDYSSHLEDVVQDRTKELKKSETMLKTLYENANDGILITDTNGIIIDSNNLAVEMHGFDKDQLNGMTIELLALEDNKMLWAERLSRLIRGEALIYETEHYRKDGSTINLEISAKAIEIEGELMIQAILRDISEKKKLQGQLLHSQKMESVGTLAGGIAHDFNNILTSILGFTDLIMEDDEPKPETTSKLRVIESAARKGSTMVSKLLSFARKGTIEAVPFMINPVIRDTLEMLSRLIPGSVHIDLKLKENLPPAKGDINQIEQVLMNLIINAKDAMPNGGHITVETDVVELSPDSLNVGTDVRHGEYIKLSITDTGKGIPKEHISRIFEPFYTTKEIGKGTGLGLAMVYGIIKEHSGYINLNSRPGRGTTFDVYLPISTMPVGLGDKAQPTTVKKSIDRILVIDDEIPVLELIKQTLLRNGYDVTVFNNPVEGLDYYRSNMSRIGLVITDMVMPAMTGDEVISEVRGLNPDIKVIAITGFFEALSNISVDGFIKKPFQGSKLITTINEIIN